MEKQNPYAWRCEGPRCNTEIPGDPSDPAKRCPKCRCQMRLIRYDLEKYAGGEWSCPSPPVPTRAWGTRDWMRYAKCYEVIYEKGEGSDAKL